VRDRRENEIHGGLMPRRPVVQDSEHVEGSEVRRRFRQNCTIGAFGIGQIAALMKCKRLPESVGKGIGQRAFRDLRHGTQQCATLNLRWEHAQFPAA